MRRKYQIAIVPLDKKGHWSKGDLLKQINFDNSFSIARYDNNIETHEFPFYQSVQLLVLSDDSLPEEHEICLYDSDLVQEIVFYRKYFGNTGKKIIASYPNIEGTLPLTKETIQEWIDNGTPKDIENLNNFKKMKKTVQIVTVPINKVGWNKKDIVINTNKEQPIVSLTSVSFGKFVADKLMTNTWQAQQLLVLSDDEIKIGDYIINNLDNLHGICTGILNEGEKRDKEYSKVIASYPHLENTLPLTKETIQQWIDNGTPKECSITVKKTIEKSIVNEWVKLNTPYTDSQGNLILDFNEKTVKASIIPTDEEIEEKAENYKHNSNLWGSGDSEECLTNAYFDGYKQALKDLGYDK